MDEGGPVHPARGYGRKRRLKSAEEGEDGGEISSDLWCECRDGCRVPAPLAGVMFTMEEIIKTLQRRYLCLR